MKQKRKKLIQQNPFPKQIEGQFRLRSIKEIYSHIGNTTDVKDKLYLDYHVYCFEENYVQLYLYVHFNTIVYFLVN